MDARPDRQVARAKDSLTGKYLTGELFIDPQRCTECVGHFDEMQPKNTAFYLQLSQAEAKSARLSAKAVSTKTNGSQLKPKLSSSPQTASNICKKR